MGQQIADLAKAVNDVWCATLDDDDALEASLALLFRDCPLAESITTYVEIFREGLNQANVDKRFDIARAQFVREIFRRTRADEAEKADPGLMQLISCILAVRSILVFREIYEENEETREEIELTEYLEDQIFFRCAGIPRPALRPKSARNVVAMRF